MFRRKTDPVIKAAIDEWLHLIDPARRRRKFSLIENPITTHAHARWIALGAYILGMVSLLIGYTLEGWGSIALMYAGLIVWTVPVMWVAYKWSKGA